MKKQRIILLFPTVLLVICFTFGTALSWTIRVSFDDGLVGDYANQDKGYNGFNGAGAATIFSDEKAVDGNRSCKMIWPEGHTGWAVCYGRITFTDNHGGHELAEGDELWVRAYYYFKSPWRWYTPTDNKILRIHVKRLDGAHGGYISFFSDRKGQIVGSTEVDPWGKKYRTGTYYDLDRWQCLEMYIHFSSQKPILRMWKDGELIVEDTQRLTLVNPTDRSDMSYIMTQWNGGAPANQVQYIDAMIYTNETPTLRDNRGNPMIGPIGWKNPPQ